MSDHFDDKIREKLQQADFPFDQDAWAKMEEKLNALNPTRKRPFFLRWWKGGLLLLLGVSAGIVTWQQTVNKPTATTLIDQHKTAATVLDTTTGTLHNINDPKAERLQQAVPDKAIAGPRTAPLQHNLQQQDVVTVNEKAIANNSHHVDKVNGLEQNSLKQQGASPVKRKDNGYPQPGNESDVVFIKPVQALGLSATDDDKPVLAAATPILESVKGNKPGKVNISSTLSTQIPELTIKTVENKRLQRHGFALGIAVGPDFSVAPGLRYGNYGVNAGLQLQYAFNNRWSVSTAAMYAKKVYGATKHDYTSPYNFEKIEANCDVIDVPLNINYTLFQNGIHSWSATVGASSYFMLREDYRYYYRYSPPKEYVYQNENQHYFSVLNLGIGYQQQSARHIMWGIQPYAKIPMAGVGNGKVKLNSIGVLFHINLTQY